jgi:hypothetical protein
MCARVDNEQSSGVVIAMCRSFRALDHQCRDLHSINLSLRRLSLTLLSQMMDGSSGPSLLRKLHGGRLRCDLLRDLIFILQCVQALKKEVLTCILDHIIIISIQFENVNHSKESKIWRYTRSKFRSRVEITEGLI